MISASSSLTHNRERESNLGQSLVNQAKNLIIAGVALKKFTEFAARDGAKTICAATTLASAVSLVLSGGNPVLGGVLATAAAIEIRGVLHRPQENISDLLENASAGLGMVRLLEERNGEVFQAIGNNLEAIQVQVIKNREKLEAIKSLAVGGQKELEAHKNKASALYSESSTLFNSAQRLFEKGHEKTQHSSEIFNSALEKFEVLTTLIKSLQGQKGDIQIILDQCLTISAEVDQICTTGKAYLDQGNEDLAQAMAVFNQAMAKQTEASEAYGQAISKSEACLQAIEERAQSDKRTEALITQTKAEAMAGCERSSNIKWIVDDIQNDIEKAQSLIESKPCWSSVILGGGAGAVLGTSYGPLGTVSGLVIGTAVAHETERRWDIKKQFSEYSVTPINSPQDKLISYTYNKCSTGWWGWYNDRQSWTVGTVSIDLGDIKVEMPFNLNEKEHKISKVHLLALMQQLERRVLAGYMSPERCLEIIESLETMKIDRSSNHLEQKRGFISQRSVYLAELRNLCNNPQQLQRSREKYLRQSAN